MTQLFIHIVSNYRTKKYIQFKKEKEVLIDTCGTVDVTNKSVDLLSNFFVTPAAKYKSPEMTYQRQREHAFDYYYYYNLDSNNTLFLLEVFGKINVDCNFFVIKEI